MEDARFQIKRISIYYIKMISTYLYSKTNIEVPDSMKEMGCERERERVIERGRDRERGRD